MSFDRPDRPLTRRQMLLRSLALAGTTTTGAVLLQRSGVWAADAPNEVQIEAFTPGGQSHGVSLVPKVVRTDNQWRQQLSPLSYEVTRHEGTERAFSGALWNQHADGLYACICCQTTLFDSRTKFESGTGWPSFWQPISKYNVTNSSDHSLFMQRTAISCRRCDAHLGHVFDDGPKPTGLRYCMNSVALQFAARA
ncbi:MAG TPA: peptide-methionine (R)-S-oxide reductase MsrB [Steroidobacteraceae bacterium]|jgi:peptide-methionine (R)-S-oxide reductase